MQKKTGDSLHTKYRPSTLDEVVGQRHIMDGLRAVLSEGTQQAFLLEGPSGTGKTTLARICASQLELEVIEIDAASNTGVDDMRRVADLARYVSLDSRGKALIIDEAHRLSKQAWESLLKIVEEPPEGVYWFFCTTEGTKVPKTIQTRCVTYSLNEVPYRALLKLVAHVAEAEGFALSDDVLDAAASEAGGSPRQALVNLAAVKHAETGAAAMAALNRAQGVKEAIDVARLVMKPNWSMTDVLPILKELKDASPEGVRIQVFAYAQTVALNNNGGTWPIHVMAEFEKPAIESNRIGDIVLRVARLHQKRRKT